MFDKFAEIDKKKEELERQKIPDAMNNIDQWNRYLVYYCESGGEMSNKLFVVVETQALPVILTASRLVVMST